MGRNFYKDEEFLVFEIQPNNKTYIFWDFYRTLTYNLLNVPYDMEDATPRRNAIFLSNNTILFVLINVLFSYFLCFMFNMYH